MPLDDLQRRPGIFPIEATVVSRQGARGRMGYNVRLAGRFMSPSWWHDKEFAELYAEHINQALELHELRARSSCGRFEWDGDDGAELRRLEDWLAGRWMS